MKDKVAVKKVRLSPVTEQELLRELHIKDWRHMSKDKVAAFVSSLPRLDPEVAKAALNQFPHFSDLGAQVIKALDHSLSGVLQSGDKNAERAYAINKQALDALLKELDKPYIGRRERRQIINEIVRIADNGVKLEQEHKNFLTGLFTAITSVAAAIIAIAGALLGFNFLRKK